METTPEQPAAGAGVARYALVMGDNEIENREVGIKPLREQREQEKVSMDALNERLVELLDLPG